MEKRYFSLRLSFIVLFSILSYATTLGQTGNCNYEKPLQANNWIFGINGKLDFSSNPPYASPTIINFGIPFGSSSISDENGNLLFFTNGETVWNKSHQVMINGNELKGSKYGGQSAIIVPNPGNSKQYFIFTTNLYLKDYKTDGINYSIVDFSNNSYGEVTSKNNQILSENSKSICAVKHNNQTDFWVIIHGFGSSKGNKFYAFLVDESGVNMSPITSTIGFNQIGDINNQTGYMKVSPDGTKIALSLPIYGVIEILEFNNESGNVSNPITSSNDFMFYPTGIEFSPDNSKLYVTTSPADPDTSYLYQIDLQNADPLSNIEIINKFPYNESLSDSLMKGLQLAVDGKIYVSKTKQGDALLPNLGVIYNPNRPGLECNYNELNGVHNNGLFLNGAGTQAGLPDFVSSFLNIPHFYYLNQCLNDTTNFIIRNTANLDATWDFKDPNGISIIADPKQPQHIFSADGIYDVDLTETYNGNDYIFTKDILIHPLPSFDIGQGSDVVYILQGSSIRLDAGDGYDVYSWNTGGSTNQYLDVNHDGEYIATVTDFNCCTNSDTVKIVYASLSYPNAFVPEGSNPLNQTFKVIGNVSAISKYQFRIFNRWGQIIFETDDPTIGWDGNQDGSPAPLGTYVYSSVFTSFESGIQSSIDIKNTGTVTLIR
jgi:gliding motility-associated-like protein